MWSERTAVITRYDHESYCQLARNFVQDIADQVVDQSILKQTAASNTKQLLFLPDLVPDVIVSRSGRNSSSEATPHTDESDEYESADELPLCGKEKYK